MSATADPAAYEQAVWTWSRHLRNGGTATWAEWCRSGPHDGTPPAGWTPPGAAQLALVRWAAASWDGDAAPAWFADTVLARTGPGRGRGQQPLSWPGTRPRASGAPPVDPADVPVEELVRVGVGVLADLVLGPGPDPAPTLEPRRRRFARGPAFRLAGAPVTTSVVRAALARAGHVEGGRNPRVVLLAEPLDQALAQVWSSRVQRGAPVRWHGFMRRWSGRDLLPPSADLPTLARDEAVRVGVDRVHVVVPHDDEDAVRRTADLLGLDRAPDLTPDDLRAARWRELSPAATDVLRRVNAVLAVRVPEPQHRGATRRATALLASDVPLGPRLTVPAEQRAWLADRAGEVAEELGSAGYPVHGPLDGLVPRAEGLPTRPRTDSVLDALLGAVRAERADRRAEGALSP